MCFQCWAVGEGVLPAGLQAEAWPSGGADPAGVLHDLPGLGGSPAVEGLLSGSRWSGPLTYSFPASPADYEAAIPEAAQGFAPLSFSQAQAARHALEGWSPHPGGSRMALGSIEGFTQASFTEVAGGAGLIRLAASAAANPTAYAYYPSAAPRGGDVWFGTQADYGRARLGAYDHATLLHEIGHALGLKHPHAAGAPGQVAVPLDRDSVEFTVMSYRGYVGQPLGGYANGSFGFPQTYMMLDIAALQVLYGADYATRSGDTTYRWDPLTGETYVDGLGQGAPGGGGGGIANRVFLTVWDGGGRDTYDLSNYATDLRLDLSPGGWSVLSGAQLAALGDGHRARGNVFNALLHQGDPRSLIEDAIGGSGHDLILGNAADNRLTGNGGNDTLDGAAGTDRVVLSGARSDYAISSLGLGQLSVRDLRPGAPDGEDLVRHVEWLDLAGGSLRVAELLGAARAGSVHGGFGPAQAATRDFTAAHGGWSSASLYPRLLGDVDGDGRDDIVGFGASNLLVARGDGGGGFGPMQAAGSAFTREAGGWADALRYPRLLADVNGDGRDDILGFGASDLTVALADGRGGFGPARAAGSAFTQFAGGWTDSDRYPRLAGDVNGDGHADIVGFGASEVFVALADGRGGFGPVRAAGSAFTQFAGGWTSQATYPRLLGDVDGDGRDDILGFGASELFVALADGRGGFGPVRAVGSAFTQFIGGWTSQEEYPRLLGDMDGDGRADILAFGASEVFLALADGRGGFGPMRAVTDAFTRSAGGWTSADSHPRLLGDLDGDGRDDILGFGAGSVFVAGEAAGLIA